MDRENIHMKRLLGENFRSDYGLNESDPLVINQGDTTVYKKIAFSSWFYFKNAVILNKFSYERLMDYQFSVKYPKSSYSKQSFMSY